ncbi:MAG: hypothetical protein AAF533_24400 [Acidobacteriota bacterium]
MTGRLASLRYLALLGILLAVSLWGARQRLAERRLPDWRRSQTITVCPLVMDGVDAAEVDQVVGGIETRLTDWFTRELGRYGTPARVPVEVTARPVRVIEGRPPELPDADSGFLARLAGTRAFLDWFATSAGVADADERDGWVYLLVGPRQGAPNLGWHGLAVRREGMAVVVTDPQDLAHAECVVAHEALHLFGATDRRNRRGEIPHPVGYAEPARLPPWPQDAAEVMALLIPISEDEEREPRGLDELVLGPLTAAEVGWVAEIPTPDGS